jgi:hypothetical protein
VSEFIFNLGNSVFFFSVRSPSGIRIVILGWMDQMMGNLRFSGADGRQGACQLEYSDFGARDILVC